LIHRRIWMVAAALLALAGVLDGFPAAAVGAGRLLVPGFAGPAPNAQDLAHRLAEPGWRQVRIEQRLIIRIAPGEPERELPPPISLPPPERMRERRIAPCVPVAAIAGVRPMANNRLVLFMHDRRLIAADLARNCSARDFYLGFYVSPTPDGLLCAVRDTIHSRAGATCMIAEVHELVPRN
jgi:hypothetical protein